MATATLKKRLAFGPNDNGTLMSPREFDCGDFDDGWTYELINGVLIVSPTSSPSERDPNEELGCWLRNYQKDHPQGSALDKTIYEEYVRIGRKRRRSDRVIWAGLGRKPRIGEKPTIVVEFASVRKRDRDRDYEDNRDEYLRVGIKEYWVIDRFQRIMTVFTRVAGKTRTQVVGEKQTYRTPLLPGFELPLAKLLALADDWQDFEEET